MVIELSDFARTLKSRQIFKHINKSLLPVRKEERVSIRDEFIADLYDDIITGEYFPSTPRGYIVHNKHNMVARIVPVLSDRDICVYYYCVKKLEAFVAVNRIPGTFGGWAFGNPLRSKEQNESKSLRARERSRLEHSEGGVEYSITGSFDPFAWREHWQEFQRVAFDLSRTEDFSHFIKFDIANFYDSINLDLLEKKRRAVVSPDLSDVVDLLFALLRNWNRTHEGYNQKSVGLPQDEISDCSRILANFYLQDYDAFVANLCATTGDHGAYLRYADDQILMSTDSFDARMILFRASKFLHKIGLNINSGKVIEFQCMDDFEHYWAFRLFSLLDDKSNSEFVNQAVEQFLCQVDEDRHTAITRAWRTDSVLRRIISVGLENINEPARSRVVDLILDRDFVIGMTSWMLQKIAPALTSSQRQDLFATLDLWVPTVPYNKFQLDVLRFYSQHMPDKDTSYLIQRIEELDNL